MTTCLLCTSEAVADGLCVEDGARLWARRVGRFEEPIAHDLKCEVIEWRGHRMVRMWKTGPYGFEREHREDCIVYLPKGQSMTPDIERAVAKAWGRS